MSSFGVWKINVKAFSHYISGHTFQFPTDGRKFPILVIYKPHLNYFLKSSAFRILFRKSPAFMSALIISRYDIRHIFYIQTQNIFPLNTYRRDVLVSQFIGKLKLIWNDIFFVSTINRKSIAIHYWQDTISGV